ncbi:MAG: D-alanyl-D-alanine carboxypeptidase/D-alanyl-D-alanine-endopeptidase, partial [Acidimicrobiia bacterium]|nr:D-alanyl-D-alanine carboxypeptidase/D-alanyl-D-alanine-endopeptidase [Acidimicrobiia bacterium]
MGVGQFVRQWVPAIVLAVAAFAVWQAAERRDTDVVSVDPVAYERSPQTPILSARRVPRTIQAPVVDAGLSPRLSAMISDSPDTSCLLVQVDDRVIEPVSDPDVGLVPASNQKLLTTYGAYLVLGSDFTYVTRVAADTTPVGGVVEGNLYFIGAGDPFLSTEEWWTQYGDDLDGRHHTRLEDLADEIATAGITEVTGTVVGDETLFDTERQGLWAERLINGKNSGPLSALTVNEGFNDWPEEFVSVRQRSETDDPPVHAASVLIQLLGERGVTVANPATSGQAPGAAIEVAQVQSPPLLDLLTHINSYSSNLGAELLLKRLGWERAGEGSAEAGAAVLIDVLEAEGIPTSGLRIDDGSGLAETNLLTCRAVAAVLAAAGPDSEFAATLAIAGERGTLAERMVDTPAAGAVFAKTGTLQDATALSGYAQSANDPAIDVVFAYIANEPLIQTNQPVIDLQDAFATALTSYPGRPSVAELS